MRGSNLISWIGNRSAHWKGKTHKLEESNLGPMCLEATKANMFADDTNLSCAGLNPSDIKTKLKRYWQCSSMA